MFLRVRCIQFQFVCTAGHAIQPCILAPDKADLHHDVLFRRKILLRVRNNVFPGGFIYLGVCLRDDDRRFRSRVARRIDRPQHRFARRCVDDGIGLAVRRLYAVQHPVLESVPVDGRCFKRLRITNAHYLRSAFLQGVAFRVGILDRNGILVAVCNVTGHNDDGVCAFHGGIDRCLCRFRRCRFPVFVRDIPAGKEVTHLIGVACRVRDRLAGSIRTGLDDLLIGIAENDHRSRLCRIVGGIIRGNLRVGCQRE